jgi:hypothetical protein
METWGRFIEFVKSREIGGAARMSERLLDECVLSSLSFHSAKVELPKGTKSVLSGLDLPRLFGEFSGHPVQLTLEEKGAETLPDSIAAFKRKKRADKRTQMEKDLLSHPNTRKARELFGGEPKVVELFDEEEDK